MKRQNSTLWDSQGLVIKLKELERSIGRSTAAVACRYNLKVIAFIGGRPRLTGAD